MNGLIRYPFHNNAVRKSHRTKMALQDTFLSRERIAPFILMMMLTLAGTFTSQAQPYLQPAEGYLVEEILPEFDTFSSFDVYGQTLYANSGNEIKGFDLANGQEVFSTTKPSDYNAWPSFVTVSPDGNQLWAGFTISGNTDDRIFHIDIASGEWNHVATLPGNVSLTFYGENILVSGAPWGDPNAIYLLDTVADNHRKIIETGGSPAGFDLDSQGNLYFATYHFSEDNELMRFAAEDLSEVISNPQAPFLNPGQATTLSSLPAGAYDLVIDDAGNVLFTINGFPDKHLAMWNGTEGEQPQFEILGTTSDDSDWLTYIHARGDITQQGEENEVFLLGFARPLVKISKTPPSISANMMENIMGTVDDVPVTIDLNNYFETLTDGIPIFEVTVNSFPEVATAEIEDNLLTISFISHGQTNIEITGTLDESEARVAFVTGVIPEIEGDYNLADFSDLTLEPESFWNGADESGGFNSGLAFFPNSHNTEWGTWSGWAYSNISDNTTPGLSNQYSAITGTALETDDTDSGIYALNYVSGAGSVLTFNDTIAREVKGIFLTNTTYAALAMMYGDEFSKKFGGETGDDPDWFKLTITGIEDGNETQSLDYYLADYRFEDNTQDYIIQTWQWVELSSLGQVDSLVFSLSSSDVGEWGMNTPAYFAADNIVIVPDTDPVTVNPAENPKNVKVFPNPSNGRFAVDYKGTGEARLTIVNLGGQTVFNSYVNPGVQPVDISSLPAGTYFVKLHNEVENQTIRILKQ